MRFLFRLDLSFHANTGFFFGILNYATKQGLILDPWLAGLPAIIIKRNEKKTMHGLTLTILLPYQIEKASDRSILFLPNGEESPNSKQSLTNEPCQ